MIHVSLRDVIMGGVFGPISIGMSPDQVREILGEPEAMARISRKDRRPRIWRYGDLQFIFDGSEDNHLGSVFIDNFGIPSGGMAIDLDPWIIRGGIALEEVEQHLRTARIDFRRAVDRYDQSIRGLMVGQRAALYFYQQDDEDASLGFGLGAFSCSDPALHSNFKDRNLTKERYLGCDVMISVSMKEFLCTGAFGPIHLGMPRTDVEEIFGPPNAMSTTINDDSLPAIWKYGDIEMHFEPSDNLSSIYTDEFDVPSGGQAIDLDPWILRRGIPWSEVGPQLVARHLSYSERGKTTPYDKATTRIVMDSGVELIFEDHVKRDTTPIACGPPGLYAIEFIRWP